MKSIQRLLACLLCLLLGAPAQAERYIGYQDAHRFTLELKETRQFNKSEVHLWHIETSHPAVTAELNAIAEAWAEEIAPSLPAPGSSNSRVEVSIRPSRTGLTWMSFLVMARTVYQEKTVDLRFTTRTYDMAAGERVYLTDIFPADSEAWPLLEASLREGVNAYYPELTADAAALDAACTREAIAKMDFTLHGMSLVLHLHGEDFYPGKTQLIESTLYYPDVCRMMSEKAAAETDNAAYYKTVALTYDDGPNGWCTRKILDTLMAAGERATFFLVGERVAQQKYFVQREHDEGHAIASHNWQHTYANNTDIKWLIPMPAKVNATHIETIGVPVRYARAPGGQWEGMAQAKLGWPLIQWSVDAADWVGEDGPNPRTTASNIAAGTDDGGIILMHDMKRNSIEATRLFIEKLQEQGYIFLTVDELFAKDGVALQPNTPYWRCTDGRTDK